MLDRANRQQLLDEISAEVRACRKCTLHRTRTHAVPGEGSCSARVMFIGEAPGYHEDQQGRPFVGSAGQLLDDLLQRAQLRRDDIFIANILKCRPPNNRDPGSEEAAACREYLDGQIALIQPEVVCLLGRVPLQALLVPGGSITRLHGQPQERDGMLWLPLFHPAAALHRPQYLPQLYQDMERLKQLLQGSSEQR
jgi:uracil-DNA glycosylase family 4